MTTSAIRRRYGYGAARLCIEARPVRYAKSPSLLPNATSGAATVLVGGLAVFALLRSIQPPEEPPSEIRIVQLQEAPPEPPPEPEPEAQPQPEPPPPEPEPEPVMVAQAPPAPPKPVPVVRKVEPPRRREPPRPKPEPVRVAQAEREPQWKRAPIAPAKPEPPPPARRPPAQIDAPKPPAVAAETPPPQAAWKAVAVARAPSARPAMPHVSIDSVTPPATPAPAAPARVASLPPGVAPARRPPIAMPSVKPVVPAAAAPDYAADAAPARNLARAAVPTPSGPVETRRPPPVKGLSMPGISSERANAPASPSAGAGRDYTRPGVTAPPAQTARSGPSSKLRGVALGSLAACRTDKLEDDLKQQVLAAVRNREECSSSAGHYRFVETKNLNAFLMWIERASGRAEGDRCVELSYALACLRRR